MTPTTENPIHRLTPEQIEEIGREFDAIHDEVYEDLGERDAAYIRGIIQLHRRLVLMGRIELFASKNPFARALGTATLSAAKILENMEIGHNVMHGQWDWMNDPYIHSRSWDWDSASTKEAWKHSHNYVHHTYTNIRGKDRDLGYEIMRIDPNQKWYPFYLAQPFYNLVLAAFFEWGVAAHDLNFDEIRSGKKDPKDLKRELKGMVRKGREQIVKDYVAWPALSGLVAASVEHAIALRKPAKRKPWQRRVKGPRFADALAGTGRETFKQTVRADFTANIVRNVWAYAIIFCGHFPDQTYTFSQEETKDETRGAKYVRQLLGAANIEGSPFFHVASGNLGYQVEHHLYPDMPSTRYAEIAPKVKEICERYELPYNTGPFLKQLGMVQRTILRLAFPGGEERPKPGPYKPSANGSEAAEPQPTVPAAST